MFTIKNSTTTFPTSAIDASSIKVECGNLIYFDNTRFDFFNGREVPMMDIHTNFGTFEIPFRSLIYNFNYWGVKDLADFFESSFIVTKIETTAAGKRVYWLEKI